MLKVRVCRTAPDIESEDQRAERGKEAQLEEGEENYRWYAGRMRRHLQAHEGWFQGQPQDSEEGGRKGEAGNLATFLLKMRKWNEK